MKEVRYIQLNQDEKEWYKTLDSFKISLDEDFDIRVQKLNNSRLLATSLLQREAIPEIRIKYFTDPVFNLSNPRKSREQVFEQNGTSGSDILSHPHFLEYLKYFIHGADLPAILKEQLTSLKQASFYDDSFVEKAYPILRSYFKSFFGNDKNLFVEEVFKMCLDLGVDLKYSKALRDKLMKMR